MIKSEYNKHLMIIILVSISLVLIFSHCVGNSSAADSNTIYVNAASGNDSWNGQSATYQQNTNNGPKLTIQNATVTISANGTINIANGIYTGDKNNNITINKNITIQGQSQTGTIINGSDNNWIFDIPSEITVKIINIKLNNGKRTNGGAIKNDGTLTVTNCTFSNNTADNGDGGAICNDYKATLTDAKCIFNNNIAQINGGAIYNDGILTDTNSIFNENTASYGGAICNENGLTEANSIFNNNIAQINGGAIYNYGSLNMDNNAFTNNTAIDGGAIINENNLIDINCTFKSNIAQINGGAIYNEGYLTLTKVTLNNNTIVSNGFGGALYNKFTGNLNLDTCNITNNSSDGGSIFNEGNIKATNTTFTSNTSSNSGGVIDSNSGTLNFTGCTFTSNSAKKNGGAIEVNGGSLSMTNCILSKNIAPNDYGGAVYANGGESGANNSITASLTGCIFKSNSAYDGGALMLTGVSIKIKSCSFEFNLAPANFGGGYGGAIHSWNCIVIIQNNTIFNNNSAASGGGAICNDDGDNMTINGGSFTNNTSTGNTPLAYGNGGAIFTLWDDKPQSSLTLNNTYLTITGTTFIGNTAPNGVKGGGAIRELGSNLNLVDCIFTNNEASNGGAIYTENGLIETNSIFKNNTATDYGGAIYNSLNASLTVKFSQIIGNTAKTGSAIYNLNGTVDAMLNWWGSNNNPSGNVYGNVTLTPWIIKIVSSVNPAQNAVNVHTNNIMVTLSEPIKAGNMWIELKNSSGTLIPFTTYINNTILTITPTKLLNNDTLYSLTLHTGSITDLAGNPLVLWGSSFSVGPSPKITITNPLNDTSNVATNKVITITFSEPIKAGNMWIELKNSKKTEIPFTKTINGKTLNITPSTLLSKGVGYTVTIHTGSVTDLAGNPVSLFGVIFTTTK